MTALIDRQSDSSRLRATVVVSKGARARPAALVTAQSSAPSAEVPALADVMLDFPAGVTETFSKD